MKPTLLFLDTKFTGLHRHTTLISLGLVAMDGVAFYAEFTDYDTAQLNPWIAEHVLAKLSGNLLSAATIIDEPAGQSLQISGSKIEIAHALQKWLAQFYLIEIWADVLAYDWMLFCDLFGGALNVPGNIFYAPFDLATLFRSKGIITPAGKYEGDAARFDFVKADKTLQHHALHDAQVEMACYQKLMSE